MKVTIRKKRWNLRFVPFLGWFQEGGKRHRVSGACDGPDTYNKAIMIAKGQSEFSELDSLLHEMLHAGLWEIDEDIVHELATDMARVLTRLGWHKEVRST